MIYELEPFLDQWRWLPWAKGKYTVHRSGAVWNVQTGRVLHPSPTTAGYMTVPVNGVNRYVHELVLETWAGLRPHAALVARHLNDVKHDNRIENLTWGTRRENSDDAKRNGWVPGAKGVFHPRAKLNEGQVRQIRAYRTYGFSVRDVARWFEVSEPTVSHIVSRRNWSHVE